MYHGWQAALIYSLQPARELRILIWWISAILILRSPKEAVLARAEHVSSISDLFTGQEIKLHYYASCVILIYGTETLIEEGIQIGRSPSFSQRDLFEQEIIIFFPKYYHNV
jgi:hypothetical protein